MANMNEDLQRERGTASFDPEKLTEYLYRGKDKVRRRRYLLNIVFQDKYLQSFKPYYNQSREESYDTTVKKTAYVIQLFQHLGITDGPEQTIMFNAAIPTGSPLVGVHNNMFIPTLQQQGTREQQEKYLEPARRYQILGTYAQTELGHGTFIRGIETTATYDPATQEFVLNSPTITSMKFWPACLGRTANHAVVMAQLYSGGKAYGLHAFVVQLRSLEDHTLLPGVKTGDIGSKMGFFGIDNGWLMFDNIRVPREAMLMKNARIEKDGTYVPPPNTKLSYGVMVFVRCMIVRNVALSLGQACTIATRYSAVRRQTEIRPGGPEPQIIDYQTQQQKLFPLIASAYALMFAGLNLEQTYTRVRNSIAQGQLGEVQVLHVLSSGLKALASYTSNNGIDKLRMACGGHGYSNASGLPILFVQTTPSCTYEGENTVMDLQCGRFLVKCFVQAKSGKALPGIISFLNQETKAKSSLTAACAMPDLIEAYEHASARLIRDAAMRVQTLIQSGVSKEQADNEAGVYIVKASELFSRTFVVKGFAKELENTNIHPTVGKVLKTLCTLYAVCGITEKFGDFLQDGFLSDQQASLLMDKMLSLFKEIRPEAVTLVDAFDFPDQLLLSCLGRYDGNVYDALYKYAQDSPLNQQEVLDTYTTTLRPLMKGQLSLQKLQSQL